MRPPAEGATNKRPPSPKYGSRGWAGADRSLTILLAATVVCYAVGYPLALIGHSDVGWVFVFLGGPLLIALLVVVIRRVQR